MLKMLTAVAVAIAIPGVASAHPNHNPAAKADCKAMSQKMDHSKMAMGPSKSDQAMAGMDMSKMDQSKMAMDHSKMDQCMKADPAQAPKSK